MKKKSSFKNVLRSPITHYCIDFTTTPFLMWSCSVHTKKNLSVFYHFTSKLYGQLYSEIFPLITTHGDNAVAISYLPMQLRLLIVSKFTNFTFYTMLDSP